MVFGLSPKSRFLCIDIQFDEMYFAVVRKTGDFFEIDFSEKLQMEKGIFEGSRMRTPGKIADVLQQIKKKFGTLPVLASVPEHFSYATLLPSETYSSSSDIRKALHTLVSTPSYVWTSTFQKNKSSYTALQSAEKEVCNTLYILVKSIGFTSIVIYPRALALSELNGIQDAVVCDFSKKQTAVFSVYNSHTIGFSLIPYGSDQLTEKMQSRFSLKADEVSEVLSAYGTDVLPRKEGHLVHGIIHTFLSPIVDEIQSLELRQSEYGLQVSKEFFVTGSPAQYNGVVEDISRMTRTQIQPLDVWEGVIDLNVYIPHIHKNESHEYAGIAGLMNILKKGTRYQPFDL